jgi:hypothetical protein
MSLLIPEIKQGAAGMLSRRKANLLIKRINALLKMQIMRGGHDDFKVSDANSVLTIKDPAGDEQAVVYIRVCKLDGTEVFIPFVTAGPAVAEADIPSGSTIYDPTP